MSGAAPHGAAPHGAASTAPGHGRSAAPAVPSVRLDVGLELVAGRARLGCKGPGAESWLRSAAVELPAQPNTFSDDAGLLVARLGSSEFFIESAAGAAALVALAAGLEARPAGVYPVLR